MVHGHGIYERPSTNVTADILGSGRMDINSCFDDTSSGLYIIYLHIIISYFKRNTYVL